MKFCSGREKVRNASGHQGENERQRKKVNKNTYDISFIKRVTRKFLEVLVLVVQNNGKEMYKKVCCTCKVAFLLIRLIVFFAVLVAFAA